MCDTVIRGALVRRDPERYGRQRDRRTARGQRAKFARISELIAAVGLERVREPYVKHLQGPLREMRMTGRGGTSRALYVTVRGRRVVVVRVFTKKTRKTPHSEVRLALQRAREVLE